jgi:hypothetical protein
MKSQRFLEKALMGLALEVARAPALLPRMAAGLARVVRLMWRAFFPAAGGRCADPGGGACGAGVPAPVTPLAPVIAAAAARALPLAD